MKKIMKKVQTSTRVSHTVRRVKAILLNQATTTSDQFTSLVKSMSKADYEKTVAELQEGTKVNP